MKKFILASILVISSSAFVTAQAQQISVNVNINSQPAWGPVGYDFVDYYYIPEINVYYNVPMSMFYYWDRGRWISARYLPYSYRNYNLYGMYKVVLNNMRDPWHYNRHHVRDFAGYRNMRNQHVIYYAKDRRYDHSRRNTAAWYKGGKHSTPPKYNNESRTGKKDYDRNHDQKRSTATGNNKPYNRNNNNDRNYSKGNNITSKNNRNEKVATQNQRNTSSEKRNNDNRQQKSVRSNSQSYLVDNTNGKNQNKVSERSSSQNNSSRKSSEKSSNTRSNSNR